MPTFTRSAAQRSMSRHESVFPTASDLLQALAVRAVLSHIERKELTKENTRNLMTKGQTLVQLPAFGKRSL